MGIKDFSELPGDLKQMSEFLGRRATRVVQDITEVVHQELVLGTPVDTGRARSNWQVSLNEPIEYSIFPYVPGKFLGIYETANATAAIEQGKRVTAQLKVGKLKVWIVNNVLYVWDLNHGSSKQQLQGKFVEAAFQLGNEFLKQARMLP